MFIAIMITILLLITLFLSAILALGMFFTIMEEVQKEEKIFIPGWNKKQLILDFDSSRLFKD